jgi:hypothetical protein
MINHNLAIPTELEPYIDENFLELCGEWRGYSLEQVQAMKPEAQILGESHVAVLLPRGERDTSRTLHIGLPYMQTWTEAHYITSEMIRRTVTPDSVAIVSTSAEESGVTVPYSQTDIRRMWSGSIKPVAERDVKALETFGVRGEVIATGYSKASLVALGIAACGSDKFEVKVVNSDEINNLRRGLWGMRKAFVTSASLADEQAAINDAGMPGFAAVKSKLAAITGHARFGLGSLSEQNQAIARAIGREDVNRLIHEARERNPGVYIKLGHVAGSRMFKRNALGLDLLIDAATPGSNLHIQGYSGPGAHRHAAGVNPIVNTLMVKQAIDISLARQNRSEA